MVARLLLILVAAFGLALVGFGAWIGWRGVFLYAADPVLMGTGGGLAVGGLLVVAQALAAWMQVRIAGDTARIRERMDRIGRRAGAPTPSLRVEPRPPPPGA